MAPDGPGLAERDGDERAGALAWAARSRDRRDQLRDELRSGARTLPEVLDARGDDHDGRVRLLYVLESLPGAGKVGTRRRLAQLGLEETTQLRDLSDDTCALLVAEFPLAVGS